MFIVLASIGIVAANAVFAQLTTTTPTGVVDRMEQGPLVRTTD
jgi:hypothetical protein